MTEAVFQRQVIQFARLRGWKCAHFSTARGARGEFRTPTVADGAGFPDLTLAHPRGWLLVRELKTDTGRVSAAQQGWLELLASAGVDASVWRPRDWPRIQAELDAHRRPEAEERTQPLQDASGATLRRRERLGDGVGGV